MNHGSLSDRQRPVRSPEPVVEILEEDGPKDEVRRDLETSDDDGMDMFYLNNACIILIVFSS